MKIERNRSNKVIFIHQKHYVDRMLTNFGMSGANPVSIPAYPYAKLQSCNVENTAFQNVPYHQAIGALLFLASISRPDISYAIGVISYLNNYNMSHWNAVKRIFNYLRETSDFGIMYKNDLIQHCDSDYVISIFEYRHVSINQRLYF